MYATFYSSVHSTKGFVQQAQRSMHCTGKEASLDSVVNRYETEFRITSTHTGLSE